MNNLEKMKELVCEQIKEMNLEKFYKFLINIETDQEGLTTDKIYFQLENLLTCKKCRELYGCPGSESDIDKTLCFERFKHYCKQEA